jgi:hypothetical protein
MGDLGHELPGHASRLAVTPRGDPHEARVIVVAVGVDDARELVQELAQLVGHQPLVGHALQGPELVRPRLGSSRRHLRLLVPLEQSDRAADVGDLAQAVAQVGQGVAGHRRAALSGEGGRAE